MTNRYKPPKRGKSPRLDLTVQEKNLQKNGGGQMKGVVIETRPHGGFRGIKQHPPNQFSFDKNQEYQRQLQKDLDKLLESDEKGRSDSPTWAIEATKEVHHGGQSQLFNKKLLAASKIERHLEEMGYGSQKLRKSSNATQSSRPTSSISRNSSRPPSRSSTTSYYRPNRTHEYLTATEMKDEAGTVVDSRLGRPTRTTLLRARQRCNSAPVNSYDYRRDLYQKTEQRINTRNRQLDNLSGNLKNILDSVIEGESVHSFLIGARYNSARNLDAKSVKDHGVYMPRDNPLACFLTRPNSAKPRTQEDSDVPSDSSVNEHYSIGTPLLIGYQGNTSGNPPSYQSTIAWNHNSTLPTVARHHYN